MKAVIFAGGFGTRLSEETDLIPKPLVHIGGEPILWHIMSIYAAFGHTEFLVALGYKGEVIKDYFTNYRLRHSDLMIDLASGEVNPVKENKIGWNITLVDTGLGAASYKSSDQNPCATISLELKFITAVKLGQELVGKAKIQKKTKSMIFLTCKLTVENKIVATASGIWKILNKELAKVEPSN